MLYEATVITLYYPVRYGLRPMSMDSVPFTEPPRVSEDLPHRTAAEDTWQAMLANAVTDMGELCRLLDLPPQLAKASNRAGGFPLLVPRPFLSRMRRGDPTDPLLLQILPQKVEEVERPGFTPDPLSEACSAGPTGSLQKYQGRLLMVTVGQCGVHCRFCFRRHFPYAKGLPRRTYWEGVLQAVRRDPSIRELILSGGDPLTLPDGELAWLVERIGAIGHVTRLRVHTRMPIVIPQRVTEELVRVLRSTRLVPLVVVHVNHPAEIDCAVARALAALVDHGIPVLSQSVLLRGVNDSPEVLCALFERLVDLRVMPYYLHQLDRVAGAAHFEVPEEQGRSLLAEIRRRLPGYAVPRYVREVPGAPAKEILA